MKTTICKLCTLLTIYLILTFSSYTGSTWQATSIISTTAIAQEIKTTEDVYYQPPLVPFTFSVNSKGDLSLRLTPHVSTPIGTFGVGLGFSVKRGNTYFVLRSKEKENVYCVGTLGKIRLTSNKSSVIDVDATEDSNVFIIDVQSSMKDVKAEFIPKPDSKELARISWHPIKDLVLSKDGSIVVDIINIFDPDFVIPLRDIDKVYFADKPDSSSELVIVYNRNGELRYLSFELNKNSIFEARWFCYCFQNVAPNKFLDVSKINASKNDAPNSSQRELVRKQDRRKQRNSR